MIKNYHLDSRSSSTRRIPHFSFNQAVDDQYGQRPEAGDVVVGVVSELGHHTRFEEPDGREIILQPGKKIAVTLGRRYSTREFFGQVPETLSPEEEFDLLNVGGVAGRVASRNILLNKPPTKLLYLGHAVNDQGEKLNTLKFGLSVRRQMPSSCAEGDLKIILVVGTDMDCGKTSTAGQIINILGGHGLRAGGGKITGTSRLKDILYMRACGANQVIDFMDVGYPSTYQCSLEELKNIFLIFKDYFMSYGCQVAVIEVADGIFQRETEMILGCQAVREEIFCLALAADSSVSAYGGIEHLKKNCDLKPDVISGLITTDYLAMEELRKEALSNGYRVQFLENNLDSKKDFLKMLKKD